MYFILGPPCTTSVHGPALRPTAHLQVEARACLQAAPVVGNGNVPVPQLVCGLHLRECLVRLHGPAEAADGGHQARAVALARLGAQPLLQRPNLQRECRVRGGRGGGGAIRVQGRGAWGLVGRD